MSATATVLDRLDPRCAHAAAGLLALFNDAGVLTAADVHVALRLDRLAAGATPDDQGPTSSEEVLLACALAVRAPRLGHVCADLETVAHTASSESETRLVVAALPWPEPSAWLDAVRSSPLVSDQDGPPDRPLRLIGTRLYLDRYWREEATVAADLLERAHPVGEVHVAALREGLARLFDRPEDQPDLQRVAAASAVLRRLTVVAGGPGTGKTTTVAKIAALLVEQAAAAGGRPPRIALAAPTGKAAARLEEAVHEAAARLPISEETKAALATAEGRTLHRLLGWRPDSSSRFRHNRGNRLPHDVVVVDETSMVPLSLMSRLLEAVRPAARLILVGDHQQLASVEAGAVLGDVVGPAAEGLRLSQRTRTALRTAGAGVLPAADGHAAPGTGGAAGADGAADAPGTSGPLVGDSVIVLTEVHRHHGAIAALARAVQAGDEDAAVDLLRADASAPDVVFLEADPADPAADALLAPVQQAVVANGTRMSEAAAEGRAGDALQELSALRLLCAHRRGPYGVALWSARVEAWLSAAVPGYGMQGRWYPGRPLLVTANDYALGLYNGDTGVVVATEDGLRAVFTRRGQLVAVSPTRLSSVEVAHALTVHKSQGSQFAHVVVLLPDETSPLLTRELLYTGLTRAQKRLTVVGTEAAVRAAVRRPIARASGLRSALWG